MSSGTQLTINDLKNKLTQFVSSRNDPNLTSSAEGHLPLATQSINSLGSGPEITRHGLESSYYSNKLCNLPNDPYLHYHNSGTQIAYKLDRKPQDNPGELFKKAVSHSPPLSNLHRYLEKAEPVVPQTNTSEVSQTRDTSVLFDILRKERQQEETVQDDLQFDHQIRSSPSREWDLEFLNNMSHAERKEQGRRITLATENVRNGIETRSTRRAGMRLTQELPALPNPANYRCKSDEENKKRASEITNGDALNRLKKSATTQLPKTGPIRTTKASRLRAAALGK